MKLSITICALWLLLAGTSASCGRDAKSHRVLFLGNSVFYSKGGLYQSFEGFCQADGLDYQAVSQWNVPANAHGVEFLDFGRIPLNLPDVAAQDEIQSLIRSGRFDYVIVEGRRPGYLLPAWVDLPDEQGRHIPYEQNLAALGKIHRTIVQSGAQTVLYMHPGTYMFPETNHPLAQIYLRLHSDLEKMEINGARHKVILVPASLLWLDALKKYGVEGWYANPGHGNPLARYASGCMLYTYLTGNDPRQNKFRQLPRSWVTSPEEPPVYVSDEDARWIKDQVWLYYSTRPK